MDRINKAKKTICIENNGTGQLAQVVKEKTGFTFDSLILKNDGRPFFPEDIATKIMEEL